ncbi:F-box/kelch-repeat protein At3g06240-like [Rhododendron vialii]|uniref:F-box/kelch-repeat protein At3g06240-like n=1 Tax=Rhododendron vialii TaxID=182163 RepID=UPI00265EF59A|nr:F-box/kelch-repeat protein At3g06240-like [Rhododendron vialii]
MKRSRTTAPEAVSSSIFSIPNPILMEILSKLPITTIRNCRCVCSYFRNLISDPEFAQLHLPKSQPHLLYRGDECTDDTLFKLNLPEGLEVLSSCNGLICLYLPRTYNPYYVWNPVVGERVIVPQTEKAFFGQCGSGFGFCSGTNQYKVLRFLTPSTGLIKLEAEINTLGTDLWRRVGDAPLYLHWYSGGCFLNGGLHWIVHDTENRFESMCCFDFGKERFQPFPGPSKFRGLRVDSMNMGALKDGLYVFFQTTIHTLDIWVMKDYAVQESWTRVFAVKIPRVEPFCGPIYRPLMVWSKGGNLLICSLSGGLFEWNMRDRSLRKVRYNGKYPSVFRAMVYIPSFISIKNAATRRNY